MITIRLFNGSAHTLWEAKSKTAHIEDAQKLGVAMYKTLKGESNGLFLMVKDETDDGMCCISWHYNPEKRGEKRWTMNVRGV